MVITQGEALLPLEGCIRSGARPGSTALNIVTGPYGTTFGNWLRDAGADVVDLAVPFDTAVTGEQVARALAERPEIDFVSLVHAEAATGNTNPVAEIGEAVRAHGALFMLDAVASVGAEPLLPDAWGVDLCVIGAQKAMGGPAGVSAVSVSDRAWERFAANPAAPRRSYLSLLDWKERWIDGGRKALPHAPAQLEMLGLEACLDRIAAEGPHGGAGAARCRRPGHPRGRGRAGRRPVGRGPGAGGARGDHAARRGRLAGGGQGPVGGSRRLRSRRAAGRWPGRWSGSTTTARRPPRRPWRPRCAPWPRPCPPTRPGP